MARMYFTGAFDVETHDCWMSKPNRDPLVTVGLESCIDYVTGDITPRAAGVPQTRNFETTVTEQMRREQPQSIHPVASTVSCFLCGFANLCAVAQCGNSACNAAMEYRTWQPKIVENVLPRGI